MLVRGWNSCCEVFTDMAKITTKVLGYGLWIFFCSVVYKVIGYSAADRCHRETDLGTTGRKHENLYIGGLRYAESKTIRSHAGKKEVPGQNLPQTQGGSITRFWLFVRWGKYK